MPDSTCLRPWVACIFVMLQRRVDRLLRLICSSSAATTRGGIILLKGKSSRMLLCWGAFCGRVARYVLSTVQSASRVSPTMLEYGSMLKTEDRL